MSAQFISGHQFVTDEIVNDSDLHEIVENATVSGVDRSNLADGEFVVTKTSDDLPPSGVETSEPWMAESTRWIMASDSSGVPTSAIPGGVTFEAADDVEAGDALRPTGMSGGVPVMTAVLDGGVLNRYRFMAAHDVASGGQGVAVAHGPIRLPTTVISGGREYVPTGVAASSPAGTGDATIGIRFRTDGGGQEWIHLYR